MGHCLQPPASIEDQRCCGSMVWGFLQDHNQIKDCSTDLGLCLQLGTTAVSKIDVRVYSSLYTYLRLYTRMHVKLRDGYTF